MTIHSIHQKEQTPLYDILGNRILLMHQKQSESGLFVRVNPLKMTLQRIVQLEINVTTHARKL